MPNVASRTRKTAKVHISRLKRAFDMITRPSLDSTETLDTLIEFDSPIPDRIIQEDQWAPIAITEKRYADGRESEPSEYLVQFEGLVTMWLKRSDPIWQLPQFLILLHQENPPEDPFA